MWTCVHTFDENCLKFHCLLSMNMHNSMSDFKTKRLKL